MAQIFVDIHNLDGPALTDFLDEFLKLIQTSRSKVMTIIQKRTNINTLRLSIMGSLFLDSHIQINYTINNTRASTHHTKERAPTYMICHCTVCGSTSNASVIRSKYEMPCKCPDCGKKVSSPHTPAVHPATDEEIKEYEAFRKSEADRVYKDLHKDMPPWEHKHSKLGA